MTVIRLSDEERKAEALLEEAEAHYADVLEQLSAVKRDLRGRDDISPAEIKRVLGEFRRATQTLFDERDRIEKLRKQELGIVHDFAVCFDEAKSEIGSRLDRLRAARDADSVSE